MVPTVTLFAALSALGLAQAANPQCVKYSSGYLSTDTYDTATANNTRATLSLNSRGEVAYFKTGSQAKINVEFQACTPNYAGEIQEDNRLFGRLYIPSTKQCLAITNPSGAPPYYVASKACLPLKDLATKASIPYNFAGFEGDDILFRASWVGGTIPSKSVYQGPKPSATNCQGTYYLNATIPASGGSSNPRGEPSVSSSSTELNRVRLFCPADNKGRFVKSYNTFVLVRS